KFPGSEGDAPGGVLLLGPRGSGKKLLAKAAAGEILAPMLYLGGPDIFKIPDGEAARRIQDLFTRAREKAPCILFIDELDALGKVRDFGCDDGWDVRERTLNQLRQELDGLARGSGVVVMASAVRPEFLDPALLRPGRFARHIIVGPPGVKGGEMTPDEKVVIAHHQLGHEIVSLSFSDADPPREISIVPWEIDALWAATRTPAVDEPLTRKAESLNKITMFLGGHASEEVVFGRLSRGAYGDQSRATEIARRLVLEHGVASPGGARYFSNNNKGQFRNIKKEPPPGYSSVPADYGTAWFKSTIIDEEVQNMIGAQYSKALDAIRKNRVALDAAAKALMRGDTLRGEELKKIMAESSN
ncbi:MAG: AAA family ATPase, partial [Desulfobacterales bacterium]|nr:AAA family ATPase [Desulfobacterales bacterium]